MNLVKTLGKGQIVIPKDIRDQMGIKNGTRLIIQIEANKITLKPLSDNPIVSLHGILKKDGPSTDDLVALRRKERKREQHEADS